MLWCLNAITWLLKRRGLVFMKLTPGLKKVPRVPEDLLEHGRGGALHQRHLDWNVRALKFKFHHKLFFVTFISE